MRESELTNNMDQRTTNSPIAPVAGSYAHGPGEIDLVDLAIVLVRRWRVMLVVLLLTVVLGATVAWLKGVNYEYSAIVDIGQRPDGVLLDSPDAVQTSIRNAIVPAIAATTETEELQELARRVKVEGIQGSGTVIVKVLAPKAMESQVSQLFAQIRERLIVRQAAAFERLIKPLQEQIAAREAEIAVLSQELTKLEAELPNVTDQARLLLIDRIGRLQQARRVAQREVALLSTDIGRTAPTRMSEDPQRSISKQGTSSTLIVALSAALGVVLAVFAAFFAEFAAHVRARLRS